METSRFSWTTEKLSRKTPLSYIPIKIAALGTTDGA
jgi:hypothetical protein